MRRSTYSEQSIAFIRRHAEEGTPVEGACQKVGILVQTYYRWRKKYDGLISLEINRLESFAKATGRSKTFYARDAMPEHLADLEDLYLVEQCPADLRAGREHTYPLDEAVRNLGLEH